MGGDPIYGYSKWCWCLTTSDFLTEFVGMQAHLRTPAFGPEEEPVQKVKDYMYFLLTALAFLFIIVVVVSADSCHRRTLIHHAFFAQPLLPDDRRLLAERAVSIEQHLDDLRKQTLGTLKSLEAETAEVRTELKLNESKMMGAVRQMNIDIEFSTERTISFLGGVETQLEVLESNTWQTRMDVSMLQVRVPATLPISGKNSDQGSLDITDWYFSESFGQDAEVSLGSPCKSFGQDVDMSFASPCKFFGSPCKSKIRGRADSPYQHSCPLQPHEEECIC